MFVHLIACYKDHPFCIVDGESWTSAKQKDAAKVFQDFIREVCRTLNSPAFSLRSLTKCVCCSCEQDAQQNQLLQYGLRPLKATSLTSVSVSSVWAWLATLS